MELHNTTNEPGAFNLEKCLTLLNNPDSEIRKIVNDFEKNKKAETKLGFNLFRLISNTYYKENFHSDILKAFLDINEQHNEGNLFLNEFLKFLQSLGTSLNIDDYSNASVFRELDHIDILIKDDSSKKAIIIENKINNAADQYQQLARYVKATEKKGYTVDCIVYVLLTHIKDPKMDGWEEKEKIKIEPLIKRVAAYNPNEKNSLHDWIKKCESLTKNDHARFILIQYQELLKQLGGQIMNTQLMEQLYQNMIIDNNFATAMSLKSMLDDLTLYRVQRLYRKFEHDYKPFRGIWLYKTTSIVFEGEQYKDFRFKAGIFVASNCYKFQVQLVHQESTIDMSTLSITLELEKEFELNDGMMQRIFDFKQEEELITYVNTFKGKLERFE